MAVEGVAGGAISKADIKNVAQASGFSTLGLPICCVVRLHPSLNTKLTAEDWTFRTPSSHKTPRDNEIVQESLVLVWKVSVHAAWLLVEMVTNCGESVRKVFLSMNS
jgi:hypothetical protein